MVTVRIDNTRSGFAVEDTTFAIRLYFYSGQNKSVKDEKLVYNKDGSLNYSSLNVLKPLITKINFALVDYFLNNGVSSKGIQVKRIQITGNDKDDFFTTLFTYNLNFKLVKISEMRYHIPRQLKEEGYFLMSNYDTHKPIGTWDIKQIDEGPCIDLTGNELSSFSREMNVIIKDSIDQKKQDKIQSENLKEGGAYH